MPEGSRVLGYVIAVGVGAALMGSAVAIRDCRELRALEAQRAAQEAQSEPAPRRQQLDLYRLAREPSIVYDSVRLDAPQGIIAKNTLPGETQLSFYLAFPEDFKKINEEVVKATAKDPTQAGRDTVYKELEIQGLLTQVVLKDRAVTPEMLKLAADNLANVDLDERGQPNYKFVLLSEEVLNQRTMRIKGAQVDTDWPLEVLITDQNGIFFANGYEWEQSRTPVGHPRYRLVDSSSQVHLTPSDPASALRYSAMGDIAREAGAARRISAQDLKAFREGVYRETTADMEATASKEKDRFTRDAADLRDRVGARLQGDAALIVDETDQALMDAASATLGKSAKEFQDMLKDQENAFSEGK